MMMTIIMTIIMMMMMMMITTTTTTTTWPRSDLGRGEANLAGGGQGLLQLPVERHRLRDAQPPPRRLRPGAGHPHQDQPRPQASRRRRRLRLRAGQRDDGLRPRGRLARRDGGPDVCAAGVPGAVGQQLLQKGQRAYLSW